MRCEHGTPTTKHCEQCQMTREPKCEHGVALNARCELCNELGFQPPRSAADILKEMAVTYEARNAVYGSNYKMVGPLMAIFFPRGAPKELLESPQFHLFELIVVKLSRLAISGLLHKDSAHDTAVYAAMIERIIEEKNDEGSGNGR